MRDNLKKQDSLLKSGIDLLSPIISARPLVPVASLPHPPFGAISGPYCSLGSQDIFYRFSSFSEQSSIYRAGKLQERDE